MSQRYIIISSCAVYTYIIIIYKILRLPTTQLQTCAQYHILYSCMNVYVGMYAHTHLYMYIYIHVNVQLIELHFCARNIITGRSAFLCNACVCTTENGAMGRQTYRKDLYVLIYCRDSRPPPLWPRPSPSLIDTRRALISYVLGGPSKNRTLYRFSDDEGAEVSDSARCSCIISDGYA